MADAQSAEEAEAAYWQLDNQVIVQNTLYSAAPATVPFLLEIAQSDKPHAAHQALELLTQIAYGLDPGKARQLERHALDAISEGTHALEGLARTAEDPAVRTSAAGVLEALRTRLGSLCVLVGDGAFIVARSPEEASALIEDVDLAADLYRVMAQDGTVYRYAADGASGAWLPEASARGRHHFTKAVDAWIATVPSGTYEFPAEASAAERRQLVLDAERRVHSRRLSEAELSLVEQVREALRSGPSSVD